MKLCPRGGLCSISNVIPQPFHFHDVNALKAIIICASIARTNYKSPGMAKNVPSSGSLVMRNVFATTPGTFVGIPP